MNKLKHFITARRISLGLILVLALVMYVSTLIPQELDSTPAKIETWRRTHEWLVWLVDAANLHRIYGQPWFAIAILFAALSLGISSFDQWIVARKKFSSTALGATEEMAASVSEQQLYAVARSHRYLALPVTSNEHVKFVKNPWGYFGVLLLHIGMTVVVAVSLYVSLTGRQGVLILVEGEQRDRRQPWDASQHGILASPLQFPGDIRLDRVRVRFDRNNQPTDVVSDISVVGQGGTVESFAAAINRISHYGSMRIYHASQHGDAFTVTFGDKNGAIHSERVLAQQPVGLDRAGYSSDFGVAWSPYLFGVKYFADADKKNMLSGNPQLVVRMLDGEKETGRTVLTAGHSAQLGEYRVRLETVQKWAKLIIVDIHGMSAIFTGFAIIMLGGLIHYMTPPRELIGVRQADGSLRVYWKAVAFKDFYGDERDDIMRDLKREATI